MRVFYSLHSRFQPPLVRLMFDLCTLQLRLHLRLRRDNVLAVLRAQCRGDSFMLLLVICAKLLQICLVLRLLICQ